MHLQLQSHNNTRYVCFPLQHRLQSFYRLKKDEDATNCSFCCPISLLSVKILAKVFVQTVWGLFSHVMSHKIRQPSSRGILFTLQCSHYYKHLALVIGSEHGFALCNLPLKRTSAPTTQDQMLGCSLAHLLFTLWLHLRSHLLFMLLKVQEHNIGWPYTQTMFYFMWQIGL